MDLRQLDYVVAIAELESFTRAAERCFVVQSALSHQVARLEHELGVRLFDRTSRRVRLTTAGHALLPAARQCLQAAERARADVAAATGEIRGNLSVGVIPTLAAIDLPAELRAYRQHYPQVRVSLITGVSNDLVDQVNHGALDVAFLGLPDNVTVTAVRSHVLAREKLAAVVAPDHPLARASNVRLERLAKEVFVDFPRGSGGRAQTDEAFANAKLTRDVAYEVLDPQLMARLIRERLGIGLIASTFAPQLLGLAIIPVVHAPFRVEHIIWTRHEPSPAARALLQQLAIPGT